MISSRAANLIFINKKKKKKKKDWTSGTLTSPPSPTSDNISFFSYPPSLSKWKSYEYHPLLENTSRMQCTQTLWLNVLNTGKNWAAQFNWMNAKKE